MNLAQMESFLKAAELQNFTLAANRLFISQPALSKQIGTLEKELGTSLFQRYNNRVLLTAAGKKLREELERLYPQLRETIEQVRSIGNGITGWLSIGIQDTQIPDGTFTRAMSTFLDENPDVELRIEREPVRTLHQSLVHGVTDLAYSMRIFGRDELLVTRQYGTLPACIAIAADGCPALRGTITCETLMELTQTWPLYVIDPAVATTDNYLPASSRVFSAAFREHGVVKYAESPAKQNFYVATGRGLAITNPHSDLAQLPDIRLLEIEDFDVFPLLVSWHRHSDNPVLRTFLRYLQLA